MYKVLLKHSSAQRLTTYASTRTVFSFYNITKKYQIKALLLIAERFNCWMFNHMLP